MRGVGVDGDLRAVNTTFETINAAATAIAIAENRTAQATIQKRRWSSWLSIYWCFGYSKHRKRIGHAVLIPDTTIQGRDNNPAPENPIQPSAAVLPFIAPPSSPASFLESEPPSVTQSPTGPLSISANMYSPSGPASIFAIGPYAHDTQLVSPPVFSTFTTEPSTAPFTPPEPSYLTTPSSPEVPFAQFLYPKLHNGESGQRYPFSHQKFRTGFHPAMLLNVDSGLSGQGSGSTEGFPWDTPPPEVVPDPGVEIEETDRFSFELTTRDSLRCRASKQVKLDEVVNKIVANDETEGNSGKSTENCVSHIEDTKANNGSEKARANGEDARRHQKHRSISLGSAKDFNFFNGDGSPKAIEMEGGPTRDWSFFPTMQPG